MKLRAASPLLAVGLLAAVTYACSSSPGIPIGGNGPSAGDKNGDGVLDDLGKAVDADKDGTIDKFKDGYAVDTNGDGKADAVGYDTDGDGLIDSLDTDLDGKIDKTSNLSGKGTGGSGTGTGGGIDFGTGGGGQGGSGATGNGKPELCDGIDNDEDGIIDNVDAGGDGICDCLNIGTIGTIGPWGQGNIFATWLDERSPKPAKAIDDKTLTAEELNGLDVIVVLRADTAELSGDPAQHAFSNAEATALATWVGKGGGLMTTIGYQGNETEEMVNVNKLLAKFSLGYKSPSAEPGDYADDWDQTHPIGKGVSLINIDNGAQPATENGTVVARSGENPAMVVATHEDGRVIVWGDEWITYNSEWTDENQQVELLWINMIKWLSPPQRCQVAIPPDLIK